MDTHCLRTGSNCAYVYRKDMGKSDGGYRTSKSSKLAYEGKQDMSNAHT